MHKHHPNRSAKHIVVPTGSLGRRFLSSLFSVLILAVVILATGATSTGASFSPTPVLVDGAAITGFVAGDISIRPKHTPTRTPTRSATSTPQPPTSTVIPAATKPAVSTPIATATATATGTATTTPTATPGGGAPIYWGAYITGKTYDSTWGDAPWDSRTTAMFEQHAGKGVSIIHWGQAWSHGGQFQNFEPGTFDIVRSHGSIPMINWNPWDWCCGVNQPQWSLSNIIGGTYDSYITQWATAAHNWGHPLFLRMMDEMNGNWYPWSEAVNGNQSGQYVQAWRHIHDIFVAVGATNVSFVWCPNTEYSGSLPLEGLYPGDAYVDWVAIDGYNWGTNPAHYDVWATFAQALGPTYNHLGTLAPTKPVMIAETASTEFGGSKANWITDALTTQIPLNFPRIKALVWFNWNADSMDWVIETSNSAQTAFAQGIASPYYASNVFGNLNGKP